MFKIMVNSLNTLIAKSLSTEVLTQRHNSRKQTIKSEALANGLASKDAQRIKQLLIEPQGYHNNHQKMEK